MKKTLYFSFILSILIYTSSLKAQVTAGFTFTPASGCAPLSVTFTNTSTGASSYLWDFGNGNVSAATNPSANYNTAGSFTVTLTATNGGDNDVFTAVVNAHPIPVADFSTSVATVCAGQTVTFIDNSTTATGTITSWAWDFGDGNGETNATGSASHNYATDGTFPASLIVTNSFGCTHSYTTPIDVLVSPTANFTATPLGSCAIPTNVNFTNTSTSNGSASFEWDFDGGSSLLENPPAFAYNSFGNYTISLIASEDGCSDTLTNINYISVQNVVPDFAANNTTVCEGQSINFTELSIPASASRTWDFGDGNTSTTSNPTHSYSAAGTYTVSLLNANGCVNSEVKDDYITVLPSPTISFTADDSVNCLAPFTVNFTDNSIGATNWAWNFGDGNTSSLQNPSHTYTAIGSYDVSLLVTNINGCTNFETKSGYISISPTVADFETDTTSGCIPLSVNFTSTSVSAASPITTYDWDFGNGTSSVATATTNNVYPADGIYTVKLVVTSASGCKDSITRTNYIKAGAPPTANFNVVTPIICHNEIGEFTDLSVGADSAFWEFDTNQGTFETPSGATLPFSPVFHSFPDTGTFFVRQTVFHNGCPDVMQLNSAIRVLPPNALFTYVQNCTNPYSVDFTDETIGADSIVWDFDDGSPLIMNDPNPTHVYGARGTYTASLTVYNYTYNCDETIQATFTIADPIASNTAVSDTSCYGVPVIFTDTSQDSDTVSWRFGDGNSANGNIVSNTYTTPGIYTATQIITDVNGCQDSTDHQIIVQGPTPDFTADTLGGCSPFVVVFTDNSASDSVLTDWSWDFGDGSPIENITSTSISHTYTNTGLFSVSMSVTDKSGCLNTVTKFNYIETTFPNPSIVADTFACLGEAVLFDASLSNVAGPALFSWDFGDGNTASGVFVTNNYTINNTYIVELTITDKYGCDSTLQHTIHIQNPAGAFTYSVISESCGSSQLQFTDQSTGLGITGWEWNFGDLGTANLQNPTHTYTSPGYYPVQLVTTNVAGCTDTVILDSIYVKGPVGSFSFTPDKGCIPHEVTFTAHSENATSFIWDFGDGFTETTSDTVTTHTYTLVSTPTPSLILSSIVNGSPCNFPAAPAGQITVTTALLVVVDSFTHNSCFGVQDGRIYTTSSGGTTPYTYQWSSSPSDNNDSLISIGAGSYTLTVSDTNNCNTETEVTITEPSEIVTAVGLNDTLCPNTLGTLTATASGGAGGYTYQWQPTGTINAGTFTATPSNNITYTVTAFDQNSCQGTSVPTSFVLYEVQAPNVQMQGRSPICEGNSTEVGVQTFGVTGTLTYSWSPSIGIGPGNFSVTPLNPTTYSLTLTNQCGETYNDTVRIEFTPPPTINISPDSSDHCFREPFIFNDNSFSNDSNDPINSWSWDFGDDTYSTEKNPIHTYTNASNYYVYVTIATDSGCTNSSSYPLKATAHPYPLALFNVNTLNLNLPFDVLSTVNKSQISTNYEWDFGDGATSTDFEPTHTYSLIGNYTINLISTSIHGCKDTTAINITTNANVEFPNAFTPSELTASGGYYDLNSLSNDVFFPYTAGVIEYNLKIFNRWGELIFVSTDVNIGWDGYYRDHLVKPGVYVWKAYLKFNTGLEVKKTGDVTVIR